MRVNLYFRLVLEAQRAGVEITYIAFDGASEEPDENTRRLVEAIADARLMPIPEVEDLDRCLVGQPATSLGQA